MDDDSALELIAPGLDATDAPSAIQPEDPVVLLLALVLTTVARRVLAKIRGLGPDDKTLLDRMAPAVALALAIGLRVAWSAITEGEVTWAAVGRGFVAGASAVWLHATIRGGQKLRADLKAPVEG